MAETVLQAVGLIHHFGGLIATNNVSLTLEHGVLHALLGPNGAGKSTLINLLSGVLKLQSGSIRLRDQDIGAASAHHRSQMGVGRSFQKTNIFPNFSALENCRLAAQSRRQHAWRLFSTAKRDRESNDIAHHALSMVNLTPYASRIATSLSHGEQRQLELAMVLATRPEVLLLDEPLAGMGAEESHRMVELLNKLAADHAVLLVEHDMDAVFAVARTITVMVDGAVIATGAPDAIRANPDVQRAYLGEHDVDG